MAEEKKKTEELMNTGNPQGKAILNGQTESSHRDGEKKKGISEKKSQEIVRPQSDCLLKYIGKAASYTLGMVRFYPGETHLVDLACTEAALCSGQFERAEQ